MFDVMKKVFTLILTLCLFFALGSLQAQMGNHWAFTKGLGLNFNYNPPKPIETKTGDNLNNLSAYSTAISNCSGELLFYANNCFLWNSEDELIKEFDKTACNSSKPTLLLPHPVQNEKYFWLYSHETNRGLRYTLIDKTKNNGKGGVVENQNDILINLDKEGRTLLPVRHQNGKDFWVLSSHDNSQIKAYPVTSDGIGDPVNNNIPNYGNYPNTFTISSRGNKLATTALSQLYPYSPLPIEEVRTYDFDAASGKISNPDTVAFDNDFASNHFISTRGVTFSPDESKLYTTYNLNYLADKSSGIVQIGLKNGKINELFCFDNSSCANIVLGPNGKIYGFCPGENFMPIIGSPNLPQEELNLKKEGYQIPQGKEMGYRMGAIVEPSPHLYSFDLSQNCADTTKFTNTSDPNEIDSVRWYFGDGDSADTWDAQHVYEEEGTYHVQMKAFTSQGSCQGHVWHSDSVEVKHRTQAGFQKDTITYACNEATLHLEDTSHNTETVQYDFGDSSFTENSSHTYDSSGTYLVRQAVESDRGCQDTLYDSIDIHIEPPPEADFTVDEDTICENRSIEVTNTSTNAGTYQWYLDSTDAGAEEIPNHKPQAPNTTYNLSLIAYNAQDCPDTLHKGDAVITVPEAQAGFALEDEEGCEHISFAFADQSENAHSWQWDFDDGNTSDVQNPDHIYRSDGDYTIEQVAINDHCTDTARSEEELTILPAPKPDFTFGEGKGYTGVAMQAESQASGDITDQYFRIPEKGHDTVREENPEFTFAEPDTFQIYHQAEGPHRLQAAGLH